MIHLNLMWEKNTSKNEVSNTLIDFSWHLEVHATLKNILLEVTQSTQLRLQFKTLLENISLAMK